VCMATMKKKAMPIKKKAVGKAKMAKGMKK
jgi:hypothetical protein